MQDVERIILHPAMMRSKAHSKNHSTDPMPGNHDVSDELLIALCARGDETAFDTLFERYKRRIWSFIRRHISNLGSAEDIFQETFLRVAKHAMTYKRRWKFSTWIYRIALNLCRDHARKQASRGSVISLDAPLSGSDNDQQKTALIEQLQSEETISPVGIFRGAHRVLRLF